MVLELVAPLVDGHPPPPGVLRQVAGVGRGLARGVLPREVEDPEGVHPPEHARGREADGERPHAAALGRLVGRELGLAGLGSSGVSREVS